MNYYQDDGADIDFLAEQYSQFWQGSVKAGTRAMETYWQAWTEFFFAPQTLTQRNLNYYREISAPPQPRWHTAYSEIGLPQNHALLVRLLDFSLPQADNSLLVPTLVLPPQAGHHSCIADYSQKQSQLHTLASNGLSAIYCIEWRSATQQTKNASIEDYIECLDYCIEKIGGKANLVGDCQGGWLAAIYAAIYPHKVNSLTLAGAPIDFQAGNGQIKQSVNYIARNYPAGGMSYYRRLVAAGNGVLNGNFLVGGFNVMRPEQLPERYLNLYQQVNDPQAVQRFREMHDWYDYAQNISGAFYLWLVQHLFRDNELILGKLEVGGRKVDMGRIDCPLFLLGGSRDHITPPVQIFNAARYTRTPAKFVKKLLVPAGHIGLFMGTDVLETTWKPLAHEIAAISKQPARIAKYA